MTRYLVQIKPITKEQAWKLRHTVLWPNKPLEYVQLSVDDIAYHYGAFVSRAPSPSNTAAAAAAVEDDKTALPTNPSSKQDTMHIESETAPALAPDLEEHLVSTLSLFKNEDYAPHGQTPDPSSRACRYRKVAVLEEWQHKGIGTQMIRFMIQWAEDNGQSSIWCRSRVGTVGFWEQFGFVAEGEDRSPGEPMHVVMRKRF